MGFKVGEFCADPLWSWEAAVPGLDNLYMATSVDEKLIEWHVTMYCRSHIYSSMPRHTTSAK